ncbi:dihydrofolate reductase family protein [Ulvibacterium sp.]|uniref:dihydrofolate reductase family protein n=1 Tax=Ulvibacterium sp. TaxID=2665914 RepID=UPI00261AC317|nr:dihydrofolate reductase family protein [Ulvibacterium sp.]
MSKIKLYIATSLDGFIAREDGSLDWLYALPNPNQIDHGYADFFESIDTIIMGKGTYEEILGFGVEWPYSNCQTYILTTDKNFKAKTEKTKIIHQVNNPVVEQMKSNADKDIWIVGGGKTITHFIDLELIDEMILCLIPTILGKGIKLFPNNPKETTFELRKSETFETGVVNLTYERKNN